MGIYVYKPMRKREREEKKRINFNNAYIELALGDGKKGGGVRRRGGDPAV